MKKLFLLLCVIVFMSALSTGCATYSKGPWSGRVIDAETKAPIEGAVVVAVWTEDYAAGVGRGSAFRDAAETLTDANGQFLIGAKSFIANLPDGKIMGPRITIFKPGYGYYPRYQISPRKGIRTYFDKPGRVVELPELKTKEERLEKKPDKYTPSVEDEHKIKLFIHMINIERKELGLDTYKEKE